MIYKRAYIIEEIAKYVDKPFVKVLNGLRRSGKSSLLKLLANSFIASGKSEDQIIHVNFESMEMVDISDSEKLYKYLIPKLNKTKRNYLLLDEIQEVSGWEKLINGISVDFDVDIYLTGSNSKLLSSELSTYLAGRYVEFHIQTLSFQESIEFTKQRLTNLPSLDIMFDLYRRKGGFPVFYTNEYTDDTVYKIVYDIYSSTILRDTVQRYHIRDIELLERVIKFAVDNIGHTFSANSIVKYFKSQQRTIDVNTIHNYLQALESSFLLYKVNRYDIRGKEVLKTQEKYFPGDFSFIYALFGLKESHIPGILETMVFLEVKRRGYHIYIGKIGNTEVDFVAEKTDHKFYIQVCYKLSSQETINREITPLLAINDAYPKYLVTMENTWQSNFEGIKHVHIRDFLLLQNFEGV